MEVNCEDCAGCCLDWRSLLDDAEGEDEDGDVNGDRATNDEMEPSVDDEPHRRRKPRNDGFRRQSLDEDATFVPLTRNEVRAFLEVGMADALTPRFWRAADDAEAVTVDGYDLAAVADRPAFFVGLRKPPKPVAPFGREDATWLPTCVFLDPTTLQCRIHGDELFPDECGAYPKHNLVLDQETECERVEATFGGQRLVDDAADEEPEGLLLGTQAIGEKLFCHPEPARLEGIIGRVASGDLTQEDRAECLAVAAASSPGTFATSAYHYEWGKTQALEPENGSWVGPAIREWTDRRADTDGSVPEPSVASDVEAARGAPETPGWDVLE